MHFKSLLVTLASCLAAAPAMLAAEPWASTYQPLPSVPTLIVNATILTGTGQRIENGSLLLSGGRIAQIGDGSGSMRGDDAVVIDAAGRWVTPGLIDVHSHLGVYASPHVKAHSDGNEVSAPVTAQVSAAGLPSAAPMAAGTA